MFRNSKSFAALTFFGATFVIAACSSTDTGVADSTDEQASAWDAESATDETKSTHLWIVNRAIDILAKQTDAVSRRVVGEMNAPACRQRWQQGLLDADFKAEFNNGNRDLAVGASTIEIGLSGATWESHFYDVDTGENYKGTGKTKGTARSQANRMAERAFAAGYDWAGSVPKSPETDSRPRATVDGETESGREGATEGSTNPKRDAACYALGVSLHYFTDMTQPMHAVNYTALDRPKGLHSNLEGYAMTVQQRFPLRTWTGEPTGTMDEQIASAARASKAQWPDGVKALENAMRRAHDRSFFTCQRLDVSRLRILVSEEFDTPECWKGDDEVDATIGKSLNVAQDQTAKYLFLAGKRMPAVP